MDQAFVQMLADRLGLPQAGDAVQPADMSTLLASRINDPVMALLVGSMLRQSEAPREDERIDACEQALTRARKIIHEQRESLTAITTMLNYIAQVFGACPACWGQNRLCQRCAGNGRPGSGPPMEAELLAWVEPALERLGRRVVRVTPQADAVLAGEPH
jgi:hypothetical protein